MFVILVNIDVFDHFTITDLVNVNILETPTFCKHVKWEWYAKIFHGYVDNNVADVWSYIQESSGRSHSNTRINVSLPTVAYDDVTPHLNLCSVKIPYYGTCFYTL